MAAKTEQQERSGSAESGPIASSRAGESRRKLIWRWQRLWRERVWFGRRIWAGARHRADRVQGPSEDRRLAGNARGCRTALNSAGAFSTISLSHYNPWSTVSA